MIDLAQEIAKAIDDQLQESGGQPANDRVYNLLWNWLSLTARKKPLANLPDRLEVMRKRIRELADEAEIHYEKGELVVRVVGDASRTLAMFERGTDWFEPYEGVALKIAEAYLS